MNVREFAVSLWIAKPLIILTGAAIGISALVIPGVQMGIVLIASLITHSVYWNRDLLETRDKVFFPFVVNILSASFGMFIATVITGLLNAQLISGSFITDVPFYYVGVIVAFFVTALTAIFKPLLEQKQ